MNVYPPAIPTQSSTGAVLLYCDSPQANSVTPLALDIGSAFGEIPLLVHPDVIRTYQQVIFELQVQVQRYRMMVERLTTRPRPYEDPTSEPSPPLNAASNELLVAISSARVPEHLVLRASETEEF